MTPTVAPPAPDTGYLDAVLRWHRPLMTLAATMAGLVLVGIVGMVVDQRVLTGVPIWNKPTIFAISITIYSVTWAWLISQLGRAQRVAWWAGTVAAVLLGVEMVIIVGDVVRGTTSHFNVSTPLDFILYMIMAGSVAAIWTATLVVSVVLFRDLGVDPARALAIRSGAVIAVIGIGLGFLMTLPQPGQVGPDVTIIGAHTVGLADGGPGLPFLGWSTVGGDLRIPHFVGMHALQVIPLFLIGCELLSRRVPALRTPAVRFRLVAVAAISYAAVLALVTWQALRGQSIVHPDALTASGLAVVLATLIAGGGFALRAARTQRALSNAAV